MRAQEFLAEDEPTRIKLGGAEAAAKARAWIDRVYARYPQMMQNNHVMTWGSGDDLQFAMFELVPSFSKRGAVEVKWFQAYPLRAGVGSRAMKELQSLAREDGISLTLFPWDKGQVSQSKLTKFYQGQGFAPTVKGGKAMQWSPELAEDLNQGIPSVLYHATYKPRLKSIKLKGLGAGGKRNWEDSKSGVIYLALDPNVAESYAESSDMVPDEWLDQIVILKISTAGLDPSKFSIDSNVQDNTGDTVEYHGVIPVSNISLYKPGLAEDKEKNHWYDAGVKDATRGARPNPRTYLPALKDKQAKHPEEVDFYMNGYKSVKQGVAESATVTRIDSKPITDFATDLKAYKHTDDWSQSGIDTGDDSYWKNKNLKTNTTKGLFAGDPRRTALYATGNAHETRYVEFTQNGQPIVYFDKKDLPAMRSRKTYLTVFDTSNFKQLPTGEWFSENPGKPIKQGPIDDPFKYIADQGWIVRVTDDLDKVFKQVKKMHKAGKIAQYGAEGMNESKQSLAESLRVDVPNEEWLQDAIEYAKRKSPTHYGLPYMGKTTATVRQVEVPVNLLKQIPGMRREQQNVRYNDLAAIEKIMKDTGKLPIHSHSNEEYKPFINVAYDGSAWVNEGNHRIMAAHRLGWDSLPVEISYFDGGERVESGPMYPGKIGL